MMGEPPAMRLIKPVRATPFHKRTMVSASLSAVTGQIFKRRSIVCIVSVGKAACKYNITYKGFMINSVAIGSAAIAHT